MDEVASFLDGGTPPLLEVVLPVLPYPDLEALTRHDVLPDGTRVLLRPLRPEDGALYPEFVAHTAPEDSRLRFFSAVKELSEERIHELTHLD